MLQPLDEERREELLGILRGAFDAHGEDGAAVVAGVLRRLAGRDLSKVWNLRRYMEPAVEQVAAEVSREATARRERERRRRQELEAAQRAQAEADRESAEQEADREQLRRAFDALAEEDQADVVRRAKAGLGDIPRQSAERQRGHPMDRMFLGTALRDLMRNREKEAG